MRNKAAASNESKLIRCIKAPLRILRKARDFYVRSMNDCANRVSYGSVMGCPTGTISTLPRSFSVNSSRPNEDDDLRELIRVASKRSLENKIEMELQQQQQMAGGVPRSFSVGIGRIDEDKPCNFDEDFKVKTHLLYPRSRSYAVTRRPGVFV
ncbi:PREDICTED: uncharacterized protein LOC104591250 [Nelumbo nucifera]|uniref:Uncharacterized protein LOC104591250 n=2 Tax=Nelumbo nucifera TaxID=4432 RepID=A0A1U7Z7H5_NELNU|nr:PREDICTED: uncharacterized protein LOC104591250 [Nelumbo nucifera]XP_010248358.1 PREDICTED: uncharacterized protein LOC104591250 [Nelumbo nucifera]DAD48219.1 TPA_asm: hypothetical protein HUJ06_018156 [Nelumbo nucifera]